MIATSTVNWDAGFIRFFIGWCLRLITHASCWFIIFSCSFIGFSSLFSPFFSSTADSFRPFSSRIILSIWFSSEFSRVLSFRTIRSPFQSSCAWFSTFLKSLWEGFTSFPVPELWFWALQRIFFISWDGFHFIFVFFPPIKSFARIAKLSSLRWHSYDWEYSKSMTLLHWAMKNQLLEYVRMILFTLVMFLWNVYLKIAWFYCNDHLLSYFCIIQFRYYRS